MKDKTTNVKEKPLDAAPKKAAENVTGTQDAKDVVAADAAPKTDVSTPQGGEIKSAEMPKSVVNTKKLSELVSCGTGSHAGVTGQTLKASGRIRFSGDAENVFGDKSAMAEGSAIRKSGDRPGRIQDTALMHVDDVPAESYTVPIHTIPQLTEPGAVIGWNGKYRNAHLISQKGSGGSPADSDFFRTINECHYDMLYYAPGQYIFDTAEDKVLKVANWYVAKKDGEVSEWKTTDIKMGNYLYKMLKLKFKRDTKYGAVTLTDFSVDGEDISLIESSDAIKRVSADTYLRERNMAEADRLAIIEKSADETKENWSPLGRVIPNSRTTNWFYGEMDKCIGDQMFLSASKLTTALKYQLNVAAQHGKRIIGTVFEMCEGNVEGSTSRFTSLGNDEGLNIDNIWKGEKLANGSAALYIAINDSKPKYNKKSKFLALPLSFKSALTTFRLNSKIFRMHQSFYDEFNRQEFFGKLDSDATGVTPYFLTDGAKVAYTVDIFGAIDENMRKIDEKDPISKIRYEDLRNVRTTNIYNYFLAGLRKYFARNASRIYDECFGGGETTGEKTLSIPMTSTTECLSLFDIFICAAAKDIAEERRYAYDIILDYETKNGYYPYHGSVKFDAINIGFTTFCGGDDNITEPMKSTVAPIHIATRIVMPEVYWLKGYCRDDELDGVGGHSADRGHLGSIVAPWYFSQNSFQIAQHDTDPKAQDKEKYNFVWEPDPNNLNHMTFFDFRGGANLEWAERVLKMDPEQLKLTLDRITVPTALLNKQIAVAEIPDLKPSVYKYSSHEDGIPIFLSYVVSADAEKDKAHISILDIIKQPRELGLSFIAPSGVVTGNKGDKRIDLDKEDGTVQYRDLDSAYFLVSGPSFRYRIWGPLTKDKIGSKLFHQVKDPAYDTNLRAGFFTICAQPHDALEDIGIVFNAAKTSEENNPEAMVTANVVYKDAQGHYVDDEIPVNGSNDKGASILASAKVISVLKYLYARLNYLPYIINPFDVNTVVLDGKEKIGNNQLKAINNHDIYDFLHIFNMCGFRAGEYNGISVDRDRARVEMGIGYVVDPYIQRRK